MPWTPRREESKFLRASYHCPCWTAVGSPGMKAVANPGAAVAFDVVVELEAVAIPGKAVLSLDCPGLVD